MEKGDTKSPDSVHLTYLSQLVCYFIFGLTSGVLFLSYCFLGSVSKKYIWDHVGLGLLVSG